jgi:uncharacterized Ntn-hydrolase superfamily protein
MAAMTYSIVARDPATGELGVAVQSHYLSVGSLCPWARAGVGAVATQSIVEPRYGPRGLDLMGHDATAAEALARLVSEDDGRDLRQVAFVDARGNVAVHTGAQCIAEAGHHTGDGFSAQANMMRDPGVPQAMAAAFTATTAAAEGDLAHRLLAALDAAEAHGGDIRGRQSAAILVVPAPADGPEALPIFDLRVEDSAEPLVELRRLVEVRRAYRRADDGDQAIATGDTAAAARAFDDARRLAPGNVELAFWRGVSLAAAGHVERAKAALQPAFDDHDGWAELLRRLPASGLFPDDPDLLGHLLPSTGEHPPG